ncbi:hypothetical protein FA95DRAFT_1563314 [Auriscalpium vulgare]|uniref:Uncharacterized protein n=1 Tax=Auriscalpium vulgare TaxID=40419 RepID=A0ACB8RGQ3_9AGAM|nr:hypothetical protein FA95DRAFT_1563314 [Auriscalpium vulgare]
MDAADPSSPAGARVPSIPPPASHIPLAALSIILPLLTWVLAIFAPASPTPYLLTTFTAAGLFAVLGRHLGARLADLWPDAPTPAQAGPWMYEGLLVLTASGAWHSAAEIERCG